MQQYFCLSPVQAKQIIEKYNIDRIKANLAYVEYQYRIDKIKDIAPYTLKAIEKDYKLQKSLFDEEKIKELYEKQQKGVEERLERDYRAY